MRGDYNLSNTELNTSQDIDVFTRLAKASLIAVKAGGWISYKAVYENEKPNYGLVHFGMSIDNLIRFKLFNRVGSQCSLTESGTKKYNELLGA